MEKFTSVLPSRRFLNAVVTLGNFDGVHLGHQKIFQHLIRRARDLRGHSIVYTFKPHPIKLLHPNRDVPLITSYEDRTALIEACGVDVLISAPFDRIFAQQSAKEFVRTILHEGLEVCEILVGYDYAFGRGRQGNTEFLRQMAERLGFRVNVVSPVVLDGITVSSRHIRKAVQKGDVALAGRMLGREFVVSGAVQPGHGRGKNLGYPTANLAVEGELIPRSGVYAVRVHLPGRPNPLSGMANLGTNPTFGDGQLSFEVHIFDFDGDLYGDKIRMALIGRLRDERRFDTPQALVEQLRLDEEASRSILKQ